VRLKFFEYLEDAAYRNASPPSAQGEQNHLLSIEKMEHQVHNGHYIPKNSRIEVCLGIVLMNIYIVFHT
jgi:hypothetical protein